MADRSSLPDDPAMPESKEPAAVAGYPSDDELLTLDQLRNSWNVQADAANSWDELGADEIVFWAQKQALNRWGRTAVLPTPAVGEGPILRPAGTEPGPGDLDADGYIWIFDSIYMGQWVRLTSARPDWRHFPWLPGWAIPIPVPSPAADD